MEIIVRLTRRSLRFYETFGNSLHISKLIVGCVEWKVSDYSPIAA
jgi:hypothetical protein